MKAENYLSIVGDLNEHLQQKEGEQDEIFSFSYETTGYTDVIKFNDHVLWHSESDNRNYLENDKQEPLIDCVKREFNKYVDTLNRIKL